MSNVAIIGATTWGNTLGRLLSNKGITVNIWAKTEARAREFEQEQQERRVKKDLPDCLSFSNNAGEVLHSAGLVICAVPAQHMRQSVRQLKNYLTSSMTLVNVAKGLEADSGKRMSQVIAEEASPISQEQVCVLSGPNLSQEINQGLPATSVIAARDIEMAKSIQSLFNSPDFTVFTSDDVVGVELCGALKNVIALGAGIVDGLELGNNAKAVLITVGWGEVVSLGTALGAKANTFYGLAGMGDLLATGNSPLSRNHYVGYELGKGRPLSEITASMSNVAEGVDTTIAVHHLVSKLNLDAPTIEFIYKVLFETLPQDELSNLLKNRLKSGTAA